MRQHVAIPLDSIYSPITRYADAVKGGTRVDIEQGRFYQTCNILLFWHNAKTIDAMTLFFARQRRLNGNILHILFSQFFFMSHTN